MQAPREASGSSPRRGESVSKRLKVVRQEQEEERTKERAVAFGLEYRDLHVWPIDREALTVVQRPEAERAETVVIRKLGKNLWLALTDPNAPATKALIERLGGEGWRVKTLLVSPQSLARALAIYQELPPAEIKEITGALTVDEARLSRFSGDIQNLAGFRTKLLERLGEDVSAVLEFILAGALALEASDVHFEMGPSELHLRLRLDGLLHSAGEVPEAEGRALVRRLKLLSGMKLNVTTTPQDGRFSLVFEDLTMELRASAIPGEYGEDVVLRILNPRTIALALEDLGIREDLYSRIRATLREPQGLVVTTGPTGSGKTTALYAFVRTSASPEVKIITIEDPIEYHLDGIAQTQVDPGRGYTFAAALRSVLRQDPDVILVGEIRDLETAEAALHAALTGHLVFTTLHTNDAIGAIPRLVDLGVKPASIAPALTLALAQRLVRRLCQHCRVAAEPSADQETRVRRELAGLPASLAGAHASPQSKFSLFTAQGCPRCMDGYKGRIGVFEALFVDENIQALILEDARVPQIREAAARAGMVTLRQDALLKALAGITTLEEIERVVGQF